MFEQTLEEMHADFYVDADEAKLCSEYGVALAEGWQRLGYLDAVKLVKQTDALSPSIRPYQRKRFLAMVKSLRTAFGPEFWQRYPSPEHLEALNAQAFRPRTRWA
jgi:hypothetical protein